MCVCVTLYDMIPHTHTERQRYTHLLPLSLNTCQLPPQARQGDARPRGRMIVVKLYALSTQNSQTDAICMEKPRQDGPTHLL